MASLNCSECDNAGCISADEVRLRIVDLMGAMMDAPPNHLSQSVDTECEINYLSACPITAGETIFQLSERLLHCRMSSTLGQLIRK